jgi:hypothetical protein
VLLVREKYEAAKVLEVGDKVKKLKKTHEWFLDLASRSVEMREQLKHDISAIKSCKTAFILFNSPIICVNN